MYCSKFEFEIDLVDCLWDVFIILNGYRGHIQGFWSELRYLMNSCLSFLISEGVSDTLRTPPPLPPSSSLCKHGFKGYVEPGYITQGTGGCWVIPDVDLPPLWKEKLLLFVYQMWQPLTRLAVASGVSMVAALPDTYNPCADRVT